jgi:hypothetical protein
MKCTRVTCQTLRPRDPPCRAPPCRKGCCSALTQSRLSADIPGYGTRNSSSLGDQRRRARGSGQNRPVRAYDAGIRYRDRRSPVPLKLENLQVTGSFKFRGALDGVIARGAVGPRSRGVWRQSRTRHRHGSQDNGPSPHGVRAADHTRGESAPNRGPRRASGAVRRGLRRRRDRCQGVGGAVRGQLHAYDDPAVIADQGTIGLEIARHAPWCRLAAISVGGGGLAAGLRPDHTVEHRSS